MSTAYERARAPRPDALRLALTQHEYDGDPTRPLRLVITQHDPHGPVFFEARTADDQLIGSAAWDLFQGQTQLLVYDGQADEVVTAVRFRPPTTEELARTPETGGRVAEVAVDRLSNGDAPLVFTDARIYSPQASSPWLNARDEAEALASAQADAAA